jgi:undecaprenyl-diphosphatase
MAPSQICYNAPMWEAWVLGVVQGLTEFLPVSSTAHLILFPWFFNWGGTVDTLTFDVALHAGTLCALLLCFWRDWLDIFLKKRRLLGLILVASLPAGVFGLLLNDIVERSLRRPLVISLSLVAVGVFMLVSEKTGVKKKRVEDITLRDAVIIGFSQAVALIPGVSRSGITISSGLFRGIERESSARFSFLLSTPVIAGAVFLHAVKIIHGRAGYDPGLFVNGFAASAVMGFVAIKFLLRFLKDHRLNIFAHYRFLLAVVIIAGIWLKG